MKVWLFEVQSNEVQPNRLLHRLQHQSMGLRRFHGFRAEGQRERRAFVPSFPLIHVVGAEEISTLARDRVQGGLIEVGKVRGEAF